MSTVQWKLFRRKDGIWRAYRTVEGRKEEISLGTRDQALAIEALGDTNRRAINPALHRRASTESFKVWIAKYWNDVSHLRGRKARKLSEASRTAYSFQIGHITRLLSDVRCCDIDGPRLEEYVAQRRDEGVRDITIGKELGRLAAILDAAWRADAILHDPRKIMPRVSADYKPGKRILTGDEAEAIYAFIRATKSPEARALGARFAFYLASGARKAECDRAERRHIDLDAGLLRIIGSKTEGSTREIPIVQPVWLQRALEGAPKSGRMYPVAENELRVFYQAATSLKIPSFSRNDLRRTFASNMLASGQTSLVVSKCLGHTSTQLLDRTYGHLRGPELKILFEANLPKKAS